MIPIPVAPAATSMRGTAWRSGAIRKVPVETGFISERRLLTRFYRERWLLYFRFNPRQGPDGRNIEIGRPGPVLRGRNMSHRSYVLRL